MIKTKIFIEVTAPEITVTVNNTDVEVFIINYDKIYLGGEPFPTSPDPVVYDPLASIESIRFESEGLTRMFRWATNKSIVGHEDYRTAVQQALIDGAKWVTPVWMNKDGIPVYYDDPISILKT